VSDSVNRRLELLQTEYIDIVQLHSCGIEILDQGDAIRALQDAKAAGKIGHVAYSRDNEAARWAVNSGLFDALQTSLNLTEQAARTSGLLAEAEDQGLGVLVKRPIGGATWAPAKQGIEPSRNYDRQYYARARAMAKLGDLPEEPTDAVLLALGFTLAHTEVDVAIVGTKSPNHMRTNLDLAERDLPISAAAVTELQARWDRIGGGWRQLQ
jgi:aryl-alcohol dehydrogenase-like predicted oxidoreductase